MKKIILISISICKICLIYAMSPGVSWVKAIGGKGNERANGITSDAEGNIIVVGRFQSTSMTADDITLTKNTADRNDFADLFILKLNRDGKALWAVTAGDLGDDHALSCTTDAKGNIYVVGYFESRTLSFGKIVLQNHNFTIGKDSVRYNSDMWLAKFSPEGICLWAKNAGGLDGNGQYSTITLDRQSSIVISGIAGGEMNFENGIKLSRESMGMYLAKYTNDGNLLWALSPKGKGEAQGVSCDPEGNIYMGGYFTGTIYFDGLKLQSSAEKNGDAFVTKYSPMGQALWARKMGGEKGEIASCETDVFGNVYLAGIFFSDTIITETDTLINKGSINHFIAKYNNDGKMLWAKSAGGNNGGGPATATREFYIDEKGNAYCTGSNWSAFTFAEKTVASVAGSEDIFVLKYNKDGQELWGLDYGGAGRNAGRGISMDQNGHLLLTGSFDEKQLKIENHTLSNAGDSDIFIVKFIE